LWASARGWAASRPATAGTFAFAISGLVIAGLSYGIWQTWWLATLWLGATFAQLASTSEASG